MLDWLTAHIPPWVILVIIIPNIILGIVAYLILLERKVASWVQDRIGPNRVGFNFGQPFLPKFHFWGLGQPLADGLKFIFKEDYRPAGVDKILFTVAPGLMILMVMVTSAVIPWGGIFKTGEGIISIAPRQTLAAAIDSAATTAPPPQWSDIVTRPEVAPNGQSARVVYGWAFQIADVNVGILFILGLLSLAVYGVVIGGWASNNKYSFLGGLRATANMISYEIPMGLAVLCIVMTFGTLSLGDLVEAQAHSWLGIIPAWNVFSQPLAFVMFLICIHAEANRAPFDLAEAEQELVGGYHTEYSSMRFALFFLAEYAGMITTSAVCVALFFGGWDFFGLRGPDPMHPALTGSLLICVLRTAVFFVKTLLVIFVFMWVRWSLPRFRFDQLMTLAWRAMIPVSLGLLLMTAVTLYLWSRLSRLPLNLWVYGRLASLLFIGNIAVVALTVALSHLIPAAPDTNRRVRVTNSRFNRTPPTGAEPVLAEPPVVSLAEPQTTT
jgi:NADH-quinone oxidoreductase subunit H